MKILRFLTPSKKASPLISAAAMILLIGMFAVPAGATILERLDLYMNGRIVSGYIKKVHRAKPHRAYWPAFMKRRSHEYAYSYTILAGGEEMRFNTDDKHEKRSHVKVYYNPQNPDGAVIRNEPYFLAYVFLGDFIWLAYLPVLFLSWIAPQFLRDEGRKKKAK